MKKSRMKMCTLILIASFVAETCAIGGHAQTMMSNVSTVAEVGFETEMYSVENTSDVTGTGDDTTTGGDTTTGDDTTTGGDTTTGDDTTTGGDMTTGDDTTTGGDMTTGDDTTTGGDTTTGDDTTTGETEASKETFEEKYVENVKATVVAYQKVKLTWDEIDEADGYLIRRRVGNGSFEELTEIKSGEYLDATASEKEYNFYRIYPYFVVDGEKVVGTSNVYVYAKAYVGPVRNLKAASVDKNAVRLSWSSVDRAVGYVIYRRNEEGVFEYLYMVKDTTYVDKKANDMEYNFYRVFPYYYSEAGNMIFGPTDTYVYAKGVLPAVTGLKAQTKNLNRVALSWEKVSGAEGYAVCRRNSEGKFEYIGKTTQLKYEDTVAVKEEYNFYRVYPYYMKEDTMVLGVSNTYVYAKGRLTQGWHWINGYKRYIDEDGEIMDDVTALVKGPYMIKVYKSSNYVIVYARDEKGTYCLPVKAMIASCGNSTPVGSYSAKGKWKWLRMVDDTYGQWSTQIVGDFLFHSVPYASKKENSLFVEKYNALGETKSLGCVRLQAGEAKWIYDNWSSVNKIIITTSETAGPIAKPVIAKLPKWHTWDPTDVYAHYLCVENGCH